MKTFIHALKGAILSSAFAISSFLFISTAKFERDPQSCGMLIETVVKRKNKAINV